MGNVFCPIISKMRPNAVKMIFKKLDELDLNQKILRYKFNHFSIITNFLLLIVQASRVSV